LLAEIRGDAAERTIFLAAARLVTARDIASDSELGPLIASPPSGVQPEVVDQLRHMHEAGTWVLLESAVADLPADLRWLFESGAVTLAQLAAAHNALGITSVADIAAAVRDQQLRRVDGFDASVEAAVADALPTIRSAIPRISLGRATSIAEPLLARVRSFPGVDWAEPVGSLRRGEDSIGDIEIVGATPHASAAIDELLTMPGIVRFLHRSENRVYFVHEGVQIGVRFPDPTTAGAALLHLTGTRAHFAALQSHAATRGLRLATAGLFDSSGALLASHTEEMLYGEMGLPFIPPEIRNGDEEIAAARGGALPALVSRSDVRGDLHMHSTWSDGRDSIEVMVDTCRSLGYEYMAITDHSPHSAATRNLSVDGVERQAEEIADLRARYPDIAILHGCEADILEDGSIDFPDRVLEQFDLVLASLHDRAGHDAAQLMTRYTAAMHHPLVNMITHPTNRMVPHRPGYDLDYGRIFEIAAASDTFLEIDGAPGHLDLDGALARRAIAAGATVAIDSDCHRAEMLERQMNLGVITARRGWVEARHVVNTLPLADLRARIARKRSGR
jgi:DNA polymerase (family X)